jgi:hypothetical protein
MKTKAENNMFLKSKEILKKTKNDKFILAEGGQILQKLKNEIAFYTELDDDEEEYTYYIYRIFKKTIENKYDINNPDHIQIVCCGLTDNGEYFEYYYFINHFYLKDFLT